MLCNIHELQDSSAQQHALNTYFQALCSMRHVRGTLVTGARLLCSMRYNRVTSDRIAGLLLQIAWYVLHLPEPQVSKAP